MANESCGVVFIASGGFHAAAAAQAAQSIRATNPSLAIDLFTDAQVRPDPFDRVMKIPNGHLRSKVDYLAASRFERTLYLDSDTRVVDNLQPLFALLDRFDIALAHSHQRRGARQNIFWRQPLPEAFPQINGGVILYRQNREVQEFLESWKRAYHEAGFKWDQVTLRELIWNSNLRFYVLPPEYNVRYAKYLDIWSQDEATPKILHFAEFYRETAAMPNAPIRHELGLWPRMMRAAKDVRRRLKLQG
jgi:hypothetical protein